MVIQLLLYKFICDDNVAKYNKIKITLHFTITKNII